MQALRAGAGPWVPLGNSERELEDTRGAWEGITDPPRGLPYLFSPLSPFIEPFLGARHLIYIL